MVRTQPGAREKRLDAPGTAAIAVRPRALRVPGPGQRVVPPLSPHRVTSRPDPSLDNQTTADASAQNDAEDDAVALAGAIAGLGEGETVRVVLEAKRSV